VSKKKILFVEDEPELVDLMKLRLESSDYDFISAYDGEEGLKKAYQEKPDLILLDVLLPKLDGLTICRRLKDDPKKKHIPVIIVSASGGRDLPERCQAAGAEHLIIKPFDAKELLDNIAKLLNK